MSISASVQHSEREPIEYFTAGGSLRPPYNAHVDPADQLPVACSLTPDAIRARKAQLLPGLVARATGRESIPHGLRLQFAASSENLQAITSTIDAERQCCPFLRFDLAVEPDRGSLWLTMSGPDGTAEFLDALLQR